LNAIVRRRATRVAGVLAALLFATTASNVGRAADAVQIDVIIPMTGQVASAGQAASKSIKAIEDAVNKSGGIAGRKVSFVIHDDQSNPQLTVQLVNEAIARGAQVIVGPSFSSSCGATLPLLKNGPVSYCFSPGIHPPPGSFMFSADWNTFDVLHAYVHYARARGWRRMAILVSTDASGQDGEHAFDAALALPENAGSTGSSRGRRERPSAPRSARSATAASTFRCWPPKPT
jgi:branched-chain amino acid transport system substrate-binding protein